MTAAAIDAAEGVFTADSELALQALADQPAEPEARAAIELVDVFDAFGTTPPRRDRASRGVDARRERAQIDRVRPGVRAVTAAGCPKYRSPASAAARSALSHYAGAVAGLTRTGDCTASTDRIVESLAHLRCNRRLGLDPARERVAIGLAHDAILTRGAG